MILCSLLLGTRCLYPIYSSRESVPWPGKNACSRTSVHLQASFLNTVTTLTPPWPPWRPGEPLLPSYSHPVSLLPQQPPENSGKTGDDFYPLGWQLVPPPVSGIHGTAEYRHGPIR